MIPTVVDDAPVSVTDRQPNVVFADRDRRPDAGRGQLSEQMAWRLSSQASGAMTLHQLHHSALTHLGEQGLSAILPQAKSRRQDPRTLARYAKLDIEAVAALTAEGPRLTVSSSARYTPGTGLQQGHR